MNKLKKDKEILCQALKDIKNFRARGFDMLDNFNDFYYSIIDICDKALEKVKNDK